METFEYISKVFRHVGSFYETEKLMTQVISLLDVQVDIKESRHHVNLTGEKAQYR